MAANFVKMAANQDLTYAAEGSLIRNMRGSILPDSLNVRATGKEVESCALRYCSCTQMPSRTGVEEWPTVFVKPNSFVNYIKLLPKRRTELRSDLKRDIIP